MTETTLSNYELTFVLKADIQEMDVEKLSLKVQNSIATRGGQILTTDNWGKQRLAYPIGKNEFGYYITLVFTHPKATIAELETEVKLMPECIRYLIISLDKENIRPEQLRRINPFAEREYQNRTSSYSRPAATEQKPAPRRSEKAESERLKELDEKLGEILEDTETKED